MNIKEVEYSRLFNLADYQNERIGFKAEISENEDINTTIGHLFFKVLEIEEVFQNYRELLRRIDNLRMKLKEKEKRLDWLHRDLSGLEAELNNLLSRDDVPSCRIIDVEEMIDQRKREIEDEKSGIKKTLNQIRILEEEKERMQENIKAGKFDFEFKANMEG